MRILFMKTFVCGEVNSETAVRRKISSRLKNLRNNPSGRKDKDKNKMLSPQAISLFWKDTITRA